MDLECLLGNGSLAKSELDDANQITKQLDIWLLEFFTMEKSSCLIKYFNTFISLNCHNI